MRTILLLATLPLAITACGTASQPPKAPPAKAETIAHETELLKITLTPEAVRRLGIVTTKVGQGSAGNMRQVSGEVVVPPTGAGGVPTGSLANLQQIGAQQAAADGEVARAWAQARLARIALDRAGALVREEAGSVRARDEAAAALAAANAALDVARNQRGLLGPAIAAMNGQSTLWVRVSLFGSDLAAISRSAPATVQALGESGAGRAARPVQAPPSANATAGTVDLFYALGNADRAFRVGQRVAVAVPLGDRIDGLSVPSGAIVRDIYGGEWVYRKTGKDAFERARVEVASEANGRALIARGLARGEDVVTVGAAELFGTEFGAAH